MDRNRIPLARLSPELAALTGQTPPSYRWLADTVRGGRLPQVVPDDNGRYYALRADLPAIAETLGLAPAPGTLPQDGNAHRALAEIAR